MTKKTILAWSPSRYAEYQQCPRKTKYKTIDRLPEPKSPALDRGTMIHAQAEHYICGRTEYLHSELEPVKAHLNKLRKGYKASRVRVEMELAFDRAWNLVEWFSKEAWLRLKVDAVEITKARTEITDWKTGKVKDGPEYDDSLNLYALGVLIAGLGKKAQSRLVFTDHNIVVTRPAGTLTLDDVPKVKETWEKRVAPMMKDTLFVPQPGMHCRWCPFSKNKGGPCDY